MQCWSEIHGEKEGEEEVIGTALLRERKRSNQEISQLELENEVLRQTTEGVLDNTVRESGTSPTYAGRLSESLDPQYVGLAISAT